MKTYDVVKKNENEHFYVESLITKNIVVNFRISGVVQHYIYISLYLLYLFEFGYIPGLPVMLFLFVQQGASSLAVHRRDECTRTLLECSNNG